MDPDTLFLHMGPGYNARMEAKLLGDQLWPPGLWFWDQPPSASFAALTQSAEEALNGLYASCQRPVSVVAHSFGVHLGVELLKRCPEQVGNCHFIAPCQNPYAGFRNLAHSLVSADWPPESWRYKAQEFLPRMSDDLDDFWRLIFLILECPDFMRAYWQHRISYEEYKTIAETVPGIDLPTFQAVLNSFHKTSPSSVDASEVNPSLGSRTVSFYLGAHDPLVNAREEAAYWRKIFPRGSFSIFEDSGHFPHLEGRGKNLIARLLREQRSPFSHPHPDPHRLTHL